jgi:hypothetical protein
MKNPAPDFILRGCNRPLHRVNLPVHKINNEDPL